MTKTILFLIVVLVSNIVQNKFQLHSTKIEGRAAISEIFAMKEKSDLPN